ncbi:hypothetical protein T12_13783 [Trichinella patagoniensis]|uniref:Uncharacterized protein n=1 Tax=Trichinella patagoniensis TaxID=990121 RepID=A0A0V0ZCN3_9BILA|nr:hypothetical protein T09_4543 [Trichinella sp. T9]KRY10313.1 hypothetical protein T12_13783 [Trichinella patagoniensis]
MKSENKRSKKKTTIGRIEIRSDPLSKAIAGSEFGCRCRIGRRLGRDQTRRAGSHRRRTCRVRAAQCDGR